MAKRTTRVRFAICVNNDGSEDLKIWKLYRVLPDRKAAKVEYLRVVDESGEDYLYPASYFVVVGFPKAVEGLLLTATT